jgi:hypothetical protein
MTLGQTTRVAILLLLLSKFLFRLETIVFALAFAAVTRPQIVSTAITTT